MKVLIDAGNLIAPASSTLAMPLIYVVFYVVICLAVLILPLLSFLRHGAILRGGAVAASQGSRKDKKEGNDAAGGEEEEECSSSLKSLQGARRQPSLTTPTTTTTTTSVSRRREAPALKDVQEVSGAVTLEEAMAPHSQSSQVFLQARRRTDVQKHRLKLLKLQGNDAAAIAAAEQDVARASSETKVSIIWDRSQLGADDRVRLVFLFTFALPIYAFWYWNLRHVKMSFLLDLYGFVRGKKNEEVVDPRLQAILGVCPVYVPIGLSFSWFVFYAFFIYLNHRDRDVSLKRHNTNPWNKLVNIFKFRLYGRYVNFKCRLWKNYFSLQLVPAYGPLPLFVFPTPSDEPSTTATVTTSSGTGDFTDSEDFTLPGNKSGGASPSRALAAAAASARHNPFYVAVKSSDSGADASPADTPLTIVVSSPPETSPFSSAKRSEGKSRPVTFAAAATATATAATNASPTGKNQRQQKGQAAGATGDEDGAGNTAEAAAESDSADEDWDEEEREMMRPRHDSHASSAFTRLPSPHSHDTLSPGRGAVHRADSFNSADLTPGSRSPSAPLRAHASPPPMRRAHYFFAAHPHGILPWCCCVNLISNVTHRDTKLFLDNRNTVLSPPDNGEGTEGARQEEEAAHQTHDIQRSLTAALRQPHHATVPSQSSSPASGAPASFPSNGSSFTTSNTRAMSPTLEARANLFFRSEPSAAPEKETADNPLKCNALPQFESSPSADSESHRAAASHSAGPVYAKGRYYIYHPSLKKFVLRLDKDEAMPATEADAEVYRQRLRELYERQQHKSKQQRESNDEAVGGGAKPSSKPLLQRLKIRIRAVVATFPFYVPLMREVYMFHGFMDASYETCERVLLYNNSTRREREGRVKVAHGAAKSSATKQHKADADIKRDFSDDSEDDENSLPEDLNHLLLFPGGASEALLSSIHGPARVLLRRRKGFLRLALHTQSGLVPVYTFGETDYFEQLSTTTTRYAAPLDDDSTFLSHDENRPTTAVGSAAAAAVATTPSLSPPNSNSTPSGTASAYYHTVIPSSTDDEGETASTGDSAAQSPTTSVEDVRDLTSARAGKTPTQKELQFHRMKELERRLLHEEDLARDRGGRRVQSPNLPAPRTRGASSSKQNTSTGSDGVPEATSSPTSTSVASLLMHNAALKARNSDAPAASTPVTRGAARLPRLVQAVQRLFQETFGISLPVVRNIIPHRVTGATVVGRPIYFELPPELQRMYTNPANYYNREKERDVLLAAQEVYFNELQELFLKYAPRYLKDPSRRKLEIL